MKLTRLVIAGTALMGTLALAAGQPNTAQAKTKKAHVISSRKMKKAAYKVNKGYFYKSTKLTKKAANAAKHPKMTFYSYKSDTIRKQNGKKAVFYYLKNKSGSVKGWIWRGDVTKQPTYAKQKKNIAAVKAIIHGMSQDVQDKTLGYFAHMNYKVAYHDGASGRDLENVIFQIELSDGNKPEDVQGVDKLYHLFINQMNSNDKESAIDAYNDFDDVRAGRFDDNLWSVMNDLLDCIEVGVEHMAN